MTINMPYQCFINGQFTDADDGKTYDTINPTDGSVSECVFIVTQRFFFIYSCKMDFLKRLFYSITTGSI